MLTFPFQKRSSYRYDPTFCIWHTVKGTYNCTRYWRFGNGFSKHSIFKISLFNFLIYIPRTKDLSCKACKQENFLLFGKRFTSLQSSLFLQLISNELEAFQVECGGVGAQVLLFQLFEQYFLKCQHY